MIGLYVHIPFCESKCPYCDFYSVPFNADTAYQYADAVIRNIKHFNERYDSVYFGGGTPMLMWEDITRILAATRVKSGAEVTVEANPRTVSGIAVQELRDSGVNRISVGAQSFVVSELRTLGRAHSPDEIGTAVKTIYDNGITNISADIMLGIPRQSDGTLKRTLKMLGDLPLAHVSAYMLKIEPGTPYHKDGITGADEETMRSLYLLTVDTLKAQGYTQYEISNFAKTGFECEHNLKYWRCQEYLGIGASAHSYYKGKRFNISPNIRRFIRDDTAEVISTDDTPGTFEEIAMLKLRLSEGMTFAECDEHGIDKKTMLERVKLIPKEYLNITPNAIALTKLGFLVSNEIIGKLALGY
ncbi:MAG: radical SAM family heme chaperone HemW [Oscillospiraceae bacterium]|jgi:oxygen-independent coproporphyrinogen-3 oxidase|nr:radical SAM family heme chaperone HemW [Oscillospiraceae bacterium]